MENDGLKKARIKNRTCYYFDDLIKIEIFKFVNNLLNVKSQGNILVHGISYKALFGSKLLRIIFDELDGFITVYEEIRYLKLLASEKYVAIQNRVRYLIIKKRSIAFVFSQYYAKLKVEFYDSLALENY